MRKLLSLGRHLQQENGCQAILKAEGADRIKTWSQINKSRPEFDSELTQIVGNVGGISVTPRKCCLFKVRFIKDFNSFALYRIV